MAFIYNAYQRLRVFLFDPPVEDVQQPEIDQNQLPQLEEGEPMIDIPLPEAPAENVANGTNVATAGGGYRRDLFPDQSTTRPDTTNTQNGRQQPNASPTGSSRGIRQTLPTVTTQPRSGLFRNDDDLPLPPDYYQRPDQALRSHENRMKRRRLEDRLEERHDRGFTKRRRLGPFANGQHRWYEPGTEVPDPDEFTIEGQQWEEFREREDRKRDGELPEQSDDGLPDFTDPSRNVGGRSRIENQRNAMQELIDLEIKAQQERRTSQMSPIKPTGDEKDRDRSRSWSGQGPTSPRPSSRSPPQQQEQPGAGGRRTSSQPPSKPSPPKQSPKKTPPPKPPASTTPPPQEPSPKRSPSKEERELAKLRIDGLPGLCGYNTTQTDPNAKPETGSGSSALPQKPEPVQKEPPSRRGPKRNLYKFTVQVTDETENLLKDFENWAWGKEFTDGKGLLCLCNAIQQSMEAQYPQDEAYGIGQLRNLAIESLDSYEANIMRQSGVRRKGKDFTADEAFAVVNDLGYNLIVVNETTSDNIWVWDNNGYIVPGQERYLVLYHEPGHWSSIGPRPQAVLRVGGTKVQMLDDTRHDDLRDIIAGLIHDPIFDTDATIDDIYARINENLSNRHRTAFKRAEIRYSLTWMNNEELLTEYDAGIDAVHRHPEVPKECSGRGCVCGFVMDADRHDEFRAALAEQIHREEFNEGQTVKQIMGHINEWYNQLTDRNDVWFDEEETRAGLKALRDDVDLVTYPLSDEDDRARRAVGIPEDC